MSASGKSSNRHYEYHRGYSTGGGHGIYAAAGARDRERQREWRRTSAPVPPAREPRPERSWKPKPGWARRALRTIVREAAKEVLR